MAGVGFGIGLALVLDEFALILHLEDVYWSEQGRTSVNAVLLVAGVIVLVLLGASPANVNEPGVGNGVFFVVAMNLGFVAVCFMKGKLGTGVIGVVTPFVALVGAVPAGPAPFGLGQAPLSRWQPQVGEGERSRGQLRHAVALEDPVVPGSCRRIRLVRPQPSGPRRRPP